MLVVIGLWIRLSVSESPIFLAAQEKAAKEKGPEPEKAPALLLLKHNWREVLIAMGARFAENVSYYVITAFILVYVVTGLGLSKSVGLNAVLIASAVHLVTIPVWGHLSDLFGRRSIYLVGAVGMAGWIFAFFPLLDTKDPVLITVATTVGLVLHGAMYGPQAAFFSELFGTRVRYSGASVGYQLASIVAGALAPLIATALLQAYQSSFPIAIYVLITCVITVVAIALARETRGADLEERDRVGV